MAQQVRDAQEEMEKAIAAIRLAKSKIETAIAGLLLVDSTRLDMTVTKLNGTNVRADELLTELIESFNAADDYRRGII